MMGRGDYVLGMRIHIFFNAGIREAQMHTDHRMVLSELRGEGAQHNVAYLLRRRFWSIKSHRVRPMTEIEAVFTTLKGGVDRTQHPTKARASWI